MTTSTGPYGRQRIGKSTTKRPVETWVVSVATAPERRGLPAPACRSQPLRGWWARISHLKACLTSVSPHDHPITVPVLPQEHDEDAPGVGLGYLRAPDLPEDDAEQLADHRLIGDGIGILRAPNQRTALNTRPFAS